MTVSSILSSNSRNTLRNDTPLSIRPFDTAAAVVVVASSTLLAWAYICYCRQTNQNAVCRSFAHPDQVDLWLYSDSSDEASDPDCSVANGETSRVNSGRKNIISDWVSTLTLSWALPFLSFLRAPYTTSTRTNAGSSTPSPTNVPLTIQSRSLPSHLRRELYKEQRREQLIPKLTLKKRMYDNIVMQDPVGIVLCTISTKKANWYVRKNLADWIPTNSTSGQLIRLRFTPKGSMLSQQVACEGQSSSSPRLASTTSLSSMACGGGDPDIDYTEDGENLESVCFVSGDKKPAGSCVGAGRGSPNDPIIKTGDTERQLLREYNASPKMNICVVCGAAENFVRHYVVPFCYRTLFPAAYKEHLPHDVVLLCVHCHMAADQHVQKRKKQWEHEARCRRLQRMPLLANDDSALETLVDRELYQVRSLATALFKSRAHLPSHRIVECEAAIRTWLSWNGLSEADARNEPLSQTEITQAMNIEYRIPNPRYISGPTLIAEEILYLHRDDERDEALASFVRDWRHFFVESMDPQYLPVGWSPKSPVKCDARE
jgi:hypothetical protein